MKFEQILARPPRVLSQGQREFYFENGYLLLDGFVFRGWLERLREVSDDEQDQWVGHISEDALRRVDLDKVEWLTGPAGSVTVHNCRTVHGSLPNMSDRGHCTWTWQVPRSTGQGLLLQSSCIPAIHGGQMCESGRPLLLHTCSFAVDATAFADITRRPDDTRTTGALGGVRC